MNSRSNIVLIGMPATGKSTYARLLAARLDMDFLDTDDVIEVQSGLSCFDLMQQHGKEKFGQLEGEVIANLDCQNTIIATGGSAVYREELLTLKSSAVFVHLHAKRRTLERRFDSMVERAVIFDNGMDFRGLYAQRMPLYEAIADIDLATDEQHGSEEQLAEKLLESLSEYKQQWAEHERFMSHAMRLAQQAESEGEVPVGAVVVVDGQVLSEGWNQVIQQQDATAHAEVQAIRAAGKALNNYRLPEATLYVTLEPCAMCAGALVHARVKTVVFGTRDPRAGAAGSVLSILDSPQLNHRCDVVEGVLAEESSDLLTGFFKAKRN